MYVKHKTHDTFEVQLCDVELEFFQRAAPKTDKADKACCDLLACGLLQQILTRLEISKSNGG